MARINKEFLIRQATEHAARANVVRKDPAVGKAASEAAIDIAQAGRSTSAFVRELRSAWARSGPPEARPACT